MHLVLAQKPFGAPKRAPEPQVGGIVGWMLAKQSEFYREMSATIRAAKSDGSAVWTLLAISFAYGIFHAAGPGHGKAVISSYLVANQETARRGIVLSFASALMQSLVAVADRRDRRLAAQRHRQDHVRGRKGHRDRQLRADRGVRRPAGLDQGRRIYARAAGARRRCLRSAGSRASSWPRPWSCPRSSTITITGMHHHDHDPDHVHDEHCGHSHGPAPSELAGPGGWQRGFGAILAVGIRPCSGAILVLVFALAQGLFWAGIAATFVMGLGTAITVATIAVIAVSAKDLARRLSGGSEGGGALVMRGIEFGAAGLVLLFGLGLLFGYLAAERVTCF